MYTVKQLSELAGVSIRTLHYYDAIELLRPSKVGDNGYRYYDDMAVLRLQQVLFYREIGLELLQIKEILDSPDFDILSALESHRNVLAEKRQRLQNLISTVDDTIRHLSGEKPMAKRQLFEAFSEETQKQYEREARLQWDPDIVNGSIKKWNAYTQAEKDAVMEEGGRVYSDLVKAIEANLPPQSPEVQTILTRWHQHIRYFYEPTLEILRGLGQGYNSHPDFIANFQKLHSDLPQFLEAAITRYVDELETTEIARMLSADSNERRHG